MSTLILYYSYTGNCATFAHELAGSTENATVEEVRTVTRSGTLATYTLGAFRAMGGKTTDIHPISADPAAFDSVILVAPIWAGNPAPAFNNMLAALPKGKELTLYMVSGGGSCSQEKITARVESAGFKIAAFHNIKR